MTIAALNTPRDMALKLFREAGRAWTAEDAESAADHLLNFCITNSALRDWVLQHQGHLKRSVAFEKWRSGAKGYFGECADMANVIKHFESRKKIAVLTDVLETRVALGPFGPIEGSERSHPSFEIVLSNDEKVDLLQFLHQICTVWEEIFRADQTLGDLPFYGYSMTANLK
ncbi:MAG: hypothetical protein KJ643_05240 [Gammaproteobacteria bacterium]|nr:hypothetical protein [Gammaproteobacteria bacterium]MBU0840593.1 hypothetical protein [Gammaproteobacteria bacterium]MBU1838281.1 hypothetical protein [Gammaproteobacteria bacterium]